MVKEDGRVVRIAAGWSSITINRGPTRFTNAGLITVIALTIQAIRKAITAANTCTAHLSLITQTGITRTGIRSRTLLIVTPTPGLTQPIVMTSPGIAVGIAAMASASGSVCDSRRDCRLDTP